MLAVEEDEQMGGRYPPNDFEQGAGEAQRTLDRFSLLVPDPGRHPEKHLEQQVVAVDQGEGWGGPACPRYSQSSAEGRPPGQSPYRRAVRNRSLQ